MASELLNDGLTPPPTTTKIIGFPYQDRQQQSHVTTAEDCKEDRIHHQQYVGGGQRGEHVDQATEDQVGFVEMIFMKQVPVCHPT